MNIYETIVIDRMHHLDLELFKHQINFTCSLLKEKYEASILDTIDNRLANIPRFPELKIFKNGIQSLARITANNRYEKFTDNDLKDFENLIINWAQQFIKLFKTSYASKLKFSKLYSWVYHTTDLIKKYGCLNGFSTKTYESLHKDFVKTPYYLSNKQNIEDQIMKMDQRQAIASKLLSRNPKNFKTINPFKFTNLIWIFDLNNA
ncbi:zn-finger domain-containing protein [Gigaspora margarita]|uniref:Zn-finger domain-containing protein n=1 Tax=Gigaspora margarita TaxID=4874 RepID=A0A8H4AKW7_GIGMA|nr:zn-finger domain-containing protein [Gigaspora margarita]